jgi:tetratricopeptide (TPR) repeat protein
VTARDHARLLAGALALAIATAWPSAQAHDDRRGDARAEAARAPLLGVGKRALAAGDAATAIEALERAAALGHAAEVELELVRAYLQAGRYRQALGFGAHVAGEHHDTTAPAALYAWLLAAGGQEPYARRVLDEALRLAPGDPLALATREAMDMASPLASGPMLDEDHAMAPSGNGAGPAPAAHARIAATAVLLDEHRALAPLAALPRHGRLWVRNGLGQTTPAAVRHERTDLGLALLQLDAPLPLDEATPYAGRDPFAGSPGFVVAYASSADGAPAWPWLRLGFLGMPAGRDRVQRRLGIAAPASAVGAPVFDAAGRLAGITLPQQAGDAVWLPISTWADWLPARPAPSPAPQRPVAPDLVYERSLRIALQLLVAD